MTFYKFALASTAIALCITTCKAEATRTSPASQTKASSSSPSSLVILFDLGSSKVRLKDNVILDRASRTFNDGKPLVMIISGSSDRSGTPQANLTLSQQRATAVLHALLDRGIPADRFQVLAKGESELVKPTPHGVTEKENRRVVITWR